MSIWKAEDHPFHLTSLNLQEGDNAALLWSEQKCSTKLTALNTPSVVIKSQDFDIHLISKKLFTTCYKIKIELQNHFFNSLSLKSNGP